MERNLIPAVMLFISISCAPGPGAGIPAPTVVPQVDLDRYAGVWYEIASFPRPFQKGCRDTKAVYTPGNDGTIEVLNSCFRNGKIDTAKGNSRVTDKATSMPSLPARATTISGSWRAETPWIRVFTMRLSVG